MEAAFLPDDFRDLLIELVDGQVDFVMVGGYAVAFHGHPRATKDLDVLIRVAPANAQRAFRALARFGAPLVAMGVTPLDLLTAGRVLQLGYPPVRIDVLNEATGITFDEAIAAGDCFELEGRSIPVIGRAALVKNKLATGRDQDRVDAQVLTKQRENA